VLQLFAIAIGGAIGAVMRYGVSNGVHQLVGRDFPYGTLSVNVLGSFLMGFLYIVLLERSTLGAEWRSLLLIGLLGAFTTFSTFSLETLNLVNSGELIKAGVNIVASVVFCLFAAWAGMLGGRYL